MAQTQKLQFVIDAENKAEATLKGVSKNLDTMQDKIKSLQPAFQKMAVIGTAAFAGITAVAGTAIKTFIADQKDMALATGVLQTAFDHLSKDQVEGLKKQLGTTSVAFTQISAEMDKAGKAALKLGFDDEAASVSFAKLFQVTGDTTQAQKDLQLAMDLSAYSGRGLEESVAAVTKVHAGGTRILKDFGIEVAEGTTATEALALANDKVTGSAQRQSETLSGQMAIMKQNFDNIKSAVGGALVEALNPLLEKLTPLIEKFALWAEQNPELLSKIILIVGAITGLVAVLGILGTILPAIMAGFAILTAPITLLVIAVVALAAVIYKNWDAIKAKTLEVFGAVRDFLVGIWNGIKDAFVSVYDFIMDKIDKILNAYNAVKEGVSNIIGKVTGKSSGKRAIGGPVSSGRSYLVGENGPEMFTPNSYGRIATAKATAGGGGINITITGNSFMGMEGVAEKIGDQIVRTLQTRMKIS